MLRIAVYPGIKCEVVEAGYANQRYFGAEKPADWKSYFFYTDKEEMVTAIRKGMVVKVVDEFETSENIEFTTRQNAVIVEHEDGTLVRYLGFKKGSLQVRPGDVILPNTPLGVNTFRSKNRYAISIFMYYLSSLDFESLQNQTLAKQKVYILLLHRGLLLIILPAFYWKTYTSFSSKEIVIKK
ncbi:M23 family metallopeptidase [Niabella sp. W65]|nr:M23 family metallopeptidase [Niabella sp. W65]MCH7369173.1 M23 family metallopeptidase [Niabella sp. W65]